MNLPSKNLELHKCEICDLYQDGKKLDDLCKHLLEQHNVKCSKATLQRKVHSWGIYKRPRRDKSDDVKQIILEEFYQNMATDEEMLDIILGRGFSMSMRALQRLRRELGCTRRAEEEAWVKTKEKLQEKLEKDMQHGEMGSYQHQTMQEHVRALGFSVGRYDSSRPQSVSKSTNF